MSNESSFLFARPSFFEGVGRLVDFGGALTMYNYSRTPEDADRVALAMDWAAVNREIEAAAEQLSGHR